MDENWLLRLPWERKKTTDSTEKLLTREWLVANGLGGYASGTVGGAVTRRYHGLLIAALPAPLGRIVMLSHLWERVRLPDRTIVVLSGEEILGAQPQLPGAPYLVEFRLEAGMPVWRYDVAGNIIEKRLLLPHRQNTVHVTYRLLSGRDSVRLTLRPSVNFRGHEEPVSEPLGGACTLTSTDDRYELR